MTGGSLDSHGPVAEAIADLWWLMLGLGSAVFVLFAVLLVLGLLRRPDEDTSDGPDQQRGLITRWIGIGGIAMPVVVIVGVFAATLVAMRDAPREATDGLLEIEITGHQFWYEVRYPDSGLVTANELHLPVGEPVALRLTSSDVIHSFWVPELGGKLDMLPDNVNTLVLEAAEPGEFRNRCAEFCGLQHAKMGLVVVAEPRDRFDDWLSEQVAQGAPTGALAEAGRDVFVSAGCVACHALRGESPTSGGPDLTTFPDRRTIAAATVPNTREHLVTWITEPDAIKVGSGMPATGLSEDELAALLAYLGMQP